MRLGGCLGGRGGLEVGVLGEGGLVDDLVHVGHVA